jgi:CheY-like chemotaxis protein
MSTKRILFVDDSPTQRALWRYSLSAKGVRIADEGAEAAAGGDEVELLVAPSPVEALELLARTRVDVLITDIDMPEMTGWELIEQAAVRDPQMESVVVSAQVRTGEAPPGVKADNVRVFSKEDRETALVWVLSRVHAHA